MDEHQCCEHCIDDGLTEPWHADPCMVGCGEFPLVYTEADRAYDRQAFASDYGLRADWL